MELYCPRCESSFDEIEESALLAGECATCQGQLTIGPPSLNDSLVAGAVALSFDTDSKIGMPITPQFDTFGVDAAADFAATTAARTAALASSAEEAGEADAGDEDEEPEAEGTATNPYAVPVDEEAAAAQSAPSPPSDGNSVFDAGSNSNADDTEATGASDTPEEEAPAEGDDAAPQTDAPGGLPAHLQPPSADFSMPNLPSFGAPSGAAAESTSEVAPAAEDAETPAANDAATEQAAPSAAPDDGSASDSAAGDATAALPAHLQLPSFPQFDMNFDPSAAMGDAPAAPEQEAPVAAEAAAPAAPEEPGGVADLPPTPVDPAQAQPEAAPPQAPPGTPAHLLPQQLPNGAALPTPQVAAPAAVAPNAAAAAPAAAEESLPSLPNFGLPNLGGAAAKREVTLLESDAAKELASELQKKRSVLPLILVSLIIIGGVAGAGYWKRAEILKVINPDMQTKRVLTKTERAEAALAKGATAFKAAIAKDVKPAVTKAKLAESVKLYETAIGLNPKLADAHLRLAVAYAKQGKKASAVEHYRRYVELVPKGSKSTSVKKIIADWDKAQKSKSSANDGGKKKKKRR